MKILSAIITRQGDRDYNEDYAISCETEKRFLFVVADGLGGHGRGEDASKSVCNSAEEFFRNSDCGISLEKLIEIAQRDLLELQVREKANDAMKTTMNVVTIEDRTVKWGHVGDTRTYYFRRGKIKKRTMDHSVPQMLVNIGEIKEAEIRHHPDRNRLLKVMGIPWEKPQYQIEKDIRVVGHQEFLLCSDGFWEYIEEKTMEKLLNQSKTPSEWLNKMEEVVKENGKGHNMDNYTALAVWIC